MPAALVLVAGSRNPHGRTRRHEVAVQSEREHLREQRHDAVRHDRSAALCDLFHQRPDVLTCYVRNRAMLPAWQHLLAKQVIVHLPTSLVRQPFVR